MPHEERVTGREEGATASREYHASAPAKVILCGEHAVVYGRPAIAVPVLELRAHAWFVEAPRGNVRVELPDLNDAWEWPPGPEDEPLVAVLDYMALWAERPLEGTLTVKSDIPIAAGMGSSAAVAVAVVRVLSQVLRRPLTPAKVAEIAYEAEKVTHGRPSGVDTSVVAFERPIWFVRNRPPAPLALPRPLLLLVADTGIRASTREVVAAVREGWERDRDRYEALFDAIGDIVRRVRRLLEDGNIPEVGPLLSENHRLLQELGVSHPAVDRLVQAALKAGAWGAKLAGAGRGGTVVALVPEAAQERVAKALAAAGARAVWRTVVGGTQEGDAAHTP